MTAGQAGGTTGERSEPARVLVVDDEDSITQLVSTVLRYEGFAVQTAADGRPRSGPPARSAPTWSSST